jgi:hypothetical protein
MNTRVSAALLAVCLAACTEQPAAAAPASAPTPSPPAPAPMAAAPPATRSDAQVAPGRWNVERVRCSDLLGASDEDRASVAMFYYGYLAAKAGIHIIDVSRIDGNIAKVMRQCAATPNLTVPQAFREALRPAPAHG